jgi:hypothetical protein
LRRRLIQQQEELDMLWWVLGGYSRDLQVPIGDVPAEAAGLIVGKELSDLVEEIPGPPAAEALLGRMLLNAAGSSTASIKLAEAVFATTDAWRTGLAQGTPFSVVGNLAPLTSGIRRTLEPGTIESAWKSWVRQALGVNLSKAWTRLDLAAQMYDEMLLHRAVGKILAVGKIHKEKQG